MDNELKGILQQIVSGQEKLEKEVTGVSKRLDKLEQGQQSLEKEVTGVSKRLDKLEQGQRSLEQGQQSLEKEVIGVCQRLDKLEQGQRSLEQGQQSLELGQQSLELGLAEVKMLATKTSIIQELEVTKKIQLIYENQVTIIEHNKQLDSFKNNLENVNTDVFALKIAVKQLQIAK